MKTSFKKSVDATTETANAVAVQSSPESQIKAVQAVSTTEAPPPPPVAALPTNTPVTPDAAVEVDAESEEAPLLDPVASDNQVACSMSGGAFQGEVLKSNVNMPRLKLVAKIDPISEHFKAGTIIVSNEATVSDGVEPLSLTIVRAMKTYLQDTPMGHPEMPLEFKTIAEVHAVNGTIEWANRQKPSYNEKLTLGVIVEANKTSDEAAFTHEFNGKWYMLATWNILKTAFRKFNTGNMLITDVNTKFRNNLLESHYEVTTLYVKAGQAHVHVPRFKIAPRRTPELVEFFKTMLPPEA